MTPVNLLWKKQNGLVGQGPFGFDLAPAGEPATGDTAFASRRTPGRRATRRLVTDTRHNPPGGQDFIKHGAALDPGTGTVDEASRDAVNGIRLLSDRGNQHARHSNDEW
jgi:hypothetical protein